MPQKNNLAFGITYNGTELMTSPTDSESVYNAMTVSYTHLTLPTKA